MLTAPNPIFALLPGAVVEIKYPAALANAEPGQHRWVVADVIECHDGTWPMVRLRDGQFTEIRPYMTWRLVRSAGQPLAA